MAFTIKPKENKTFTEMMRVFSTIVEDSKFSVSDEGVESKGMDTAMICAMALKIKPGFFSQYNVKGKQEFSINQENLFDILKRFTDGYTITMEERLKVFSDTKQFDMSVLADVVAKEIPEALDTMTWNHSIEVDSFKLKEGINDLELFGDVIQFETDGTGLRLYQTHTTGEGKINLIPIVQNENLSIVRVPLDYLKKVVSSEISDKVVLGISPSYPLKIEYKNPEYEMRFIVAPRVDEN